MESRRKFLKKSLYLAPIVISAAVRPSFAQQTYGGGGNGSGNEPPIPGRGERRRRWRGTV